MKFKVDDIVKLDYKECDPDTLFEITGFFTNNNKEIFICAAPLFTRKPKIGVIIDPNKVSLIQRP